MSQKQGPHHTFIFCEAVHKFLAGAAAGMINAEVQNIKNGLDPCFVKAGPALRHPVYGSDVAIQQFKPIAWSRSIV